MTFPGSPWRRLYESRAVPAALLALFVVLIGFTIVRFSIWYDESCSLEFVSENSYANILKFTTADVHPPLWYLALKPWVTLFGATTFASRAQSAVFMIVAVALWYHLVRTRMSRPLALLALALMVTNPMLLHYAVEGRMYACGTLLTAISTLQVTSTWRGRWIAYWPCAVAMLYVHYFLAFVVAGQFLYLLVRRREQDVTILWIVLYGASIIAAFGPWLPSARHQSAHVIHDGFWIPPIDTTTVVSYVQHAFLHRLESEVQSWRTFPAMLYLVVFAGTLACAARGGRKLLGGRGLLMWAVWLVPWLALFVLSCKPSVPVFHPRYVIFGLPAIIVLLAAGALSLRGRWRVAVIAVLMAGHVSGIANVWWRGFHEQRGFWSMKEIAEDLRKPIDGELPLVLTPWQFPFFDARVTLAPEQRVVWIRRTRPEPSLFPDDLFYGRPDWWTISLSSIKDKHVWFIEEASAKAWDFPANWKKERDYKNGYLYVRLFTVTQPAP